MLFFWAQILETSTKRDLMTWVLDMIWHDIFLGLSLLLVIPWEPTFSSFLGVISPIFLGLKPSCFHGFFWSPRVVSNWGWNCIVYKTFMMIVIVQVVTRSLLGRGEVFPNVFSIGSWKVWCGIPGTIFMVDVLFFWAVLSHEQMSNRWSFSLLNDEQMSNKVGVEHQAVFF